MKGLTKCSRTRSFCSFVFCRFQALSYAMMALRDMGADIPDVAFPVLRCEMDGSDLADKLRMLKGGRRAPSEADPGRVCGELSPGQGM